MLEDLDFLYYIRAVLEIYDLAFDFAKLGYKPANLICTDPLACINEIPWFINFKKQFLYLSDWKNLNICISLFVEPA